MLERILNSNGQILPESGFLGFVLRHWVILSVAVMLLGFLVDQILYMVRYRPQDGWMHAYYAFRGFLTEKFGVRPASKPKVKEKPNPLMDSGMTQSLEDAQGEDVVFHSAHEPVVQHSRENRSRREEAAFREEEEERETFTSLRREPEPRVQARPGRREEAEAPEEDIPIVVRSNHRRLQNQQDHEPTTLRR